jgi:predicted transcriptional regulator
MAGTKLFFVRLPPDPHLRLKITAAERERPMSKLVVEAIVQYLERTEEASGG